MPNDILKLIGNTPLMRLDKIAECVKAKIFAKAEYLNPSGSIKDRVALKMIQDATEKGLLKPGYTILESGPGNTGIALSFVGCLLGFKVVIYETTPGKVGVEKRKLMQCFGAEIRSLPPPVDYMEKSIFGAEVEYPGRVPLPEDGKFTSKTLVGPAI